MRILIIEDEEELLNDIADGLKLFGYAVDTASDGEYGEYMLSINTYDILILDLNLPTIDGIDVLKNLRKSNKDIKVLILSARSDLDSRVEGLDLGANDYLVKPFHFAELNARIRSLLRRRFETENPILTCAGIEIDTNNYQVTVNSNQINLSNKEYGILFYLIKNKGKYISQEELLEHIWDENADVFTSSVRVHISYLRKKISPFIKGDMPIINQTGKGYMIIERGGSDENLNKS